MRRDWGGARWWNSLNVSNSLGTSAREIGIKNRCFPHRKLRFKKVTCVKKKKKKQVIISPAIIKEKMK